MSLRSTTATVTFAHPFSLSGMDDVLPAGTYTVETEEELVEGLSFPAYRRLSTVLLLPGAAGSSIRFQALDVDPSELEEALRRDALADGASGPASDGGRP
jgi:hypothetical protein